ncbi:L10-interacting MYB domain-containing protein [Camellia lanceoleosa]|uniref:L10-interacting MYB domain-containing protein n=1 Tax=Camellia lanceoleosa TaxID=1840588 RepID=A0ACC0HQ80_9ERIC|nr:L10-interacting MYB domain-containing protein [Camellia lanceoleosa]
MCTKVVWDSNAVRLFLELVVKELESGYKGCVHIMTMHGYRAVSKVFQERTSRFHEVKQLQNKYNLLKKDWQSWARLMDTRHGPTSISYNEETGLIQASDDWWAKYEKFGDLLDIREFNRGGMDFYIQLVASDLGNGTFGYAAPVHFYVELAYTMKVNEKLDVYSFGVLIGSFNGEASGDLISSLSSSRLLVYGVLLKDILDTPPISWESFGRRSAP